MIGLILLLVALPLLADPITYGLDLTVPCSGYEVSAHCVTGTIVYFVWEPPYGFVPMTQQLDNRWADKSVPEPEQSYVAPPLAPVVATPEPAVRFLITVIGSLLALQTWTGRRANA